MDGRAHGQTGGVHGNREDWDPMGPMGSHGNGSKISHDMGMGIKCMGMGVKTWELSPKLRIVFCSYIVTWSKGSNAGGARA